jgi:hypothetical protein
MMNTISHQMGKIKTSMGKKHGRDNVTKEEHK